MKIKAILITVIATILLLALVGCSAAPSPDDNDVKELVIEIFRKHKAGYNSRIELGAIRTISVNEKIRKTIACAKFSMYASEAAPPINYEVVYSAQYTTDDQLYVTVLEIEIKGN